MNISSYTTTGTKRPIRASYFDTSRYSLAIALTAIYTQTTIHRYPETIFFTMERPTTLERPGWPEIATSHRCHRRKSNMDAAQGEGVTSK